MTDAAEARIRVTISNWAEAMRCGGLEIPGKHLDVLQAASAQAIREAVAEARTEERDDCIKTAISAPHAKRAAYSYSPSELLAYCEAKSDCADAIRARQTDARPED